LEKFKVNLENLRKKSKNIGYENAYNKTKKEAIDWFKNQYTLGFQEQIDDELQLLEEDIGEYEDDEMFLVLFLVFLIMIIVVITLIAVVQKIIFPAIIKTFRQCINILERRSIQDEPLIELDDEKWQI
jgi:predicted RND superfamily exporter protein